MVNLSRPTSLGVLGINIPASATPICPLIGTPRFKASCEYEDSAPTRLKIQSKVKKGARAAAAMPDVN